MSQHRDALPLVCLLLCGLLLSLSPFIFAAEVERPPNIVFLMTDDQRWDNFGCYGRPEFETHHIDRLAEEGVIFDNAYYAVSICMPSRVTMMTGRYLSNHYVGFSVPYNQSLPRADFARSYPAQLKRAGYRVGFIGKFGFSVTKQAQRSSLIKKETYHMEREVGNVFDFFADEQGTHTQGGGAIWPTDDQTLQAIYEKGRKGTSRTLKTGEAMLHFLNTQPKDQPFCLSISYNAVKHDSTSHIYAPHYEKFISQDFSVPDNWVEGGNDKLPQVVAENWRGHRLHVERSSTPEMYQRLVRRFAAQGYTVDQQVGMLMDKLEESGILDNTIVIYTSDNGRFQGSHGLFDKALLYEESIKAPLIIYDGRLSASERGRRERAMVSSVDMAPTILSLAGLTPPQSMQGHDLSKVLNQTQDMSEWQDAVFMENLFLVNMIGHNRKPDAEKINRRMIAENRSYRCHGVRTDRWKYFVYYEHDPVIEELYDMSQDPLEQNNLIDAPEHAEVLTELRQKTKSLYREIAR